MFRPAHDSLLDRLLIATGRAADRLTATVTGGATGGPWLLLPLALVIAVALDDALLLPRAPSYAVLGLLDEPAHLATSLILLTAVTASLAAAGRAVRTGFAVGLLLAGNLIDVDHVPQVLGSEVITAGTPRPYSHSVTLLLLLVLIAVAGRGRVRAVAAGVTIGVTGHLTRDLGTSPIALFWPLTPDGLTIPHSLYLTLLACCALVPPAVRALNPSHGPADTRTEASPADTPIRRPGGPDATPSGGPLAAQEGGGDGPVDGHPLRGPDTGPGDGGDSQATNRR